MLTLFRESPGRRLGSGTWTAVRSNQAELALPTRAVPIARRVDGRGRERPGTPPPMLSGTMQRPQTKSSCGSGVRNGGMAS
ncbi:MAG: hypothetical protein JXA67_21535 [Micromonosporaceae bacterium]|nr:hypothetical protein [Micromonosporaceae bacterium]